MHAFLRKVARAVSAKADGAKAGRKLAWKFGAAA
jgi:hypothetical protein